MNQSWVYMCPHPETPSQLPLPHPIPQGHPSALALSAPSHALNLEMYLQTPTPVIFGMVSSSVIRRLGSNSN